MTIIYKSSVRIKVKRVAERPPSSINEPDACRDDNEAEPEPDDDAPDGDTYASADAHALHAEPDEAEDNKAWKERVQRKPYRQW